MRIIKTGLITDKIIKDYIAKAYNVKTSDITTQYNIHKGSVKYSFIKNERVVNF